LNAMDHVQAMNSFAPERYILGEMTEDERLAFEEHYFSCAECADDVRAGGLMRDGARAGLIGAPASRAVIDAPEFRKTRGPRGNVVPLPQTVRRWVPAVVIPWAAAATFAILAGSESLVLQRALRGGADPIALAPATLRQASRGQEPVVSRGPGGVVTLAVDVDPAALDHELEYELRRADNTAVASGRVPAPQDGSPLLLMIPASLLRPAEHYALTLKNPGKPDLTPSSYRFTVGAP
jgi:hypothetical protein